MDAVTDVATTEQQSIGGEGDCRDNGKSCDSDHSGKDSHSSSARMSSNTRDDTGLGGVTTNSPIRASHASAWEAHLAQASDEQLAEMFASGRVAGLWECIDDLRKVGNVKALGLAARHGVALIDAGTRRLQAMIELKRLCSQPAGEAGATNEEIMRLLQAKTVDAKVR